VAQAYKDVKPADVEPGIANPLPGHYDFYEEPFGHPIKPPYKGAWIVKVRFAPLLNERPWNAPWSIHTFTMK